MSLYQQSAALRRWLGEGRVRAPIILLLLALLPLTLLLYSRTLLRRQAVAQAQSEGGGMAHFASALAQQNLQNGSRFVQSLANRRLLREAWQRRDIQAVNRHLRQAHELFPETLFFSMYDTDGTMRAIYPPDASINGRNFAFRDWFRGVSQAWQPYISEAYQTAAAPYPMVVAIAVPVHDSAGRPIGILMAPYPLETISGWLGEIAVGGEWHISLVDQNGTVLADSRPEGPNRSQQREDDPGLLRSYAPVLGKNWTAVAERPEAKALQSLNAAERQVMLLAAIFFVVALGLMRLLATLYERAQVGERFFALSRDLLCVAGFDGYFKRLNQSWQQTLGFTQKELTAKPYLEFVHPADREATLAAAGRLSDDNPILSFENRYVGKDGSYRWFSWSATPVTAQRVVFAAARDVTERKSAEEQIAHLNRQLQLKLAELGAANRELESFCYSVSHDLRAPLRHIDGFSKILCAEVGTHLSPASQRHLDRILQATRTMGQLIDDLLNLSRIGRQPLSFQSTPLAVLVAQVVEQLKEESNGRQIEWRIGHLPAADCDPGLMRQVFANLLSNAVKFTRLRERAVIEVDHLAGEGPAVFCVRDNGAGFSMKYVDKLFGVFQRLHRQEEFEGTGVGLAIVQRIIQRHGGAVWAEAEPGQGAAFFFTLPAGRVRQQTNVTEVAAHAQ